MYHDYNKDEWGRIINWSLQVGHSIVKKCFPNYVAWGVEYVSPKEYSHLNNNKIY